MRSAAFGDPPGVEPRRGVLFPNPPGRNGDRPDPDGRAGRSFLGRTSGRCAERHGPAIGTPDAGDAPSPPQPGHGFRT